MGFPASHVDHPGVFVTRGSVFFDLCPFWWIWNEWRRKEINYGGEERLGNRLIRKRSPLTSFK